MSGLTFDACSGEGHRAPRNRSRERGRQGPMDSNGLLAQASLALDEPVSGHPALRANITAGGEPCPLSLVATRFAG